MKIKFIIEEIYSLPDTYGNTYSYAIVTNTRNGKVEYYDNKDRNIYINIIKKYKVSCEEVYYIRKNIKIRDFNANYKNAKKYFIKEEV